MITYPAPSRKEPLTVGAAVRTDGFVGAKNFGFFVGVDVHGDP
jgi:hypothetical protein